MQSELDKEELEHFRRMNILFLLGMMLIGMVGGMYSLVLFFLGGIFGFVPLAFTIIFEYMFYVLKGMYRIDK